MSVQATPAAPAPAAAMPITALAPDRWRAAEIVFWLLPVLVFFALPGYLVLGSQILIMGLFALSLDLILGYAGIVSLGHAAFFGVGAYTAGLLAAHGWGEPLSGLLLSGAMAAAVGWLAGFLVVRGRSVSRSCCSRPPTKRVRSPAASTG
jgi:branched-chain amino acid transport system permease protein